MRTRATIRGFALAIVVLALAVFVIEAIHELNYASGHPYAYGPAKVIAAACGAGAALSVAVGLAILFLMPLDRGE